MANQRWSADKNIEFINEYKRNECLWDNKHPQYKSREAREAAYKNIMDAMKMENLKDVICKIRILRNTYNNEMLKTKKCHTNNEQYVSKIPWLTHMDFLKNIDNTRENERNVPPNINQETSGSNREELTATQALKRKIEDPLHKTVDALEKTSSQRLSNAGNDEFDLFGQTITQQLRQLPLEIAIETEEIILSTIRTQRMKVLSLRPTSPCQTNPSNSVPECVYQTSESESGALASDGKERKNPVKREIVTVPEWSDVRVHFSRTTGGSARCAFCTRTTKHEVSNMSNHIRTCHRDVWAQRIQELTVEESDSAQNSDTEHHTDMEASYDDTNTTKDVFTEVVYLEDQQIPTKAKRARESTSPQREKIQLIRESPPRSRNELSSFLNYVECLMKTLPPDVSTKTQLDVINLIMTAKINSEAAAKQVNQEPKFNINISADGNQATIIPITSSV